MFRDYLKELSKLINKSIIQLIRNNSKELKKTHKNKNIYIDTMSDTMSDTISDTISDTN